MLMPTVSSPKRMPFGSGVNFVWDGNSLVQGVGATDTTRVSAVVDTLAPIAGTGQSAAVNCGTAGQTWTMMNGQSGGNTIDVDGAFVNGKSNVLFLWEFTNSIFGNPGQGVAAVSVSQAIADCVAYIAARKAAKQWRRIVMLNCIPRYSTTLAASLDQVNAYLAANYRSMGVDLLVDVQRPGSPFAFTGSDASKFTATQALWSETANWTHLTAAGYAVIAGYVAADIRRLRA